MLLHGNPTWSSLYRKIVPHLQDTFRCIAVDYPGFGLSDRPDGYGYTPHEHARVIGELVDHLTLDGFLIMIQDWGGPIGLDIATRRADRVRGIVHGNTWFWPADTMLFKIFRRVMSTRYMQRQILEKNFFVERIMPRSMGHPLLQTEMDHFRNAQPTPEPRVGVAEFPRQILRAKPLLARLKDDVPRLLGEAGRVCVGDEGSGVQAKAGFTTRLSSYTTRLTTSKKTLPKQSATPSASASLGRIQPKHEPREGNGAGVTPFLHECLFA